MKKSIFFPAILCTLLFSSTVAYAQLKVDHTGRILVGTFDTTRFDQFGVLSMCIRSDDATTAFGGSKLAFGDFGRRPNMGWNVFIGEYDTNDSDRMWLHGKRGILLTNLDGNVMAEVGIVGDDGSLHSSFKTHLYANSLKVYSNDQQKNNRVLVSNALPRLLELQSWSYNYKVIQNYVAPDNQSQPLSSPSATGLTNKERGDLTLYNASMKKLNDGFMTYGFLTSQLRNLFPELVTTDEEGNTYVDYVALIPVLVAALGEQQTNIQMLQGQVAVMSSAIIGGTDSLATKSMTRSAANADGTMYDVPVLHQNSPNPFSSQTTISYYIPTNATGAAIYLFNLNGTLLQTLPVTTMGNGSVTIDGETLAAGMYVYSLVVDGTIVDSKRMILTGN